MRRSLAAAADGWRPPEWLSSRALQIAMVAAAGLFLATFPLLSDSLYYQNMIMLSLVLAVGAVGLNIVSGYAGYISLGHSAFLGVGAYTAALIADRTETSPFIWVPAAGLVGVVVAAGLGVIAMRARGDAFVIITIVGLFLLQITAINWKGLTNGTTGITLPLPPWDSDIQNWPFYYALFALLLGSLALSWWIRRTKFGMGLIAIREDEDKAETIGVNTPVYKIVGFMASAVFVSMAGAVYGYYVTFVDPVGMFGILLSVQMVLAILLGGSGTLFGPVLGAFIVEPLNEYANNSLGGGNSRLLIFGGLMALTVLFMPKGIIPGIGELLRRRRERDQAGLVGERLDAALEPGKRSDRPQPAPVSDRMLLEIRGLEKRFGGIKAVDGCSFGVPEGSITALIGPNGSGKTTLFNMIDGTMSTDAGEVWFEGARIDRLRPWARAHAGLGRTFQITRLLPKMTVLENVVAPMSEFRLRQLTAGAVSGSEADRAGELLEFVGMRKYQDAKAADLSYGQQKLVELAQILMLDPKLIMLDEPAGGINPTLIERMGDMIRELNARGKTFLIVEHNMPFVLGLCNPVRVLARGTCISQGAPEEVRKDPKVLDAYLGDDFAVEQPLRT
jgi:ABC-type branched-subunit amino acid transport system ATPase component/ABC-type branched-subunit amino acid transport system permease subunit